MNCEDLAKGACPCKLADSGQCRCCSLLMGKDFCNCDYPGFCVYERYRWEDKQQGTVREQLQTAEEVVD